MHSSDTEMKKRSGGRNNDRERCIREASLKVKCELVV